MVIKYKYPRLQGEWHKLLYVNPGLVLVVLSVANELGGSATLTEIDRSKKTQAIYYPNSPGKLTVHFFWRGVDIRVRGYSRKKLNKVVAAINKRFPYGKGRIKTAILHSVGQGLHIHVQSRTI